MPAWIQNITPLCFLFLSAETRDAEGEGGTADRGERGLRVLRILVQLLADHGPNTPVPWVREVLAQLRATLQGEPALMVVLGR